MIRFNTSMFAEDNKLKTEQVRIDKQDGSNRKLIYNIQGLFPIKYLLRSTIQGGIIMMSEGLLI